MREQYTKQVVTHADLLPARVGKQKTIDYLLDRTLMRPRDMLQYFNACIKQADGKPDIKLTALREAEGIYSRERLRALADEWYGLYPNLFHLTNLLKRKPPIFTVRELPIRELEENYLELLVSGQSVDGLDGQLMKMVFEEAISLSEYRLNIILIFYKVGLVGVKIEPFNTTSWADSGGVNVSRAEVTDETRMSIHKTFWRCLGVSEAVQEEDV